MFSTVPRDWRSGLESNITIQELNTVLVQLHIPAIVFIAILMVLGVFGNIVVIYIFTTKYYISTYRGFILWLGWIDLISCTVGMPLLIVSMLHPYMFPSEAACKTLRFLHVFFVVSSAFIVIAIAIERHRRICYPFSIEMTTNKITAMCLAASILGCLVAVPSIFVFGDAVVETGVHNITGTECFIDAESEHTDWPQGYFIFQLTLSIVSMIILGIFYYRIGKRIWYHDRFIRNNTYTGKGQKDECKRKEKVNQYISKKKNKYVVQNGQVNQAAMNSRPHLYDKGKRRNSEEIGKVKGATFSTKPQIDDLKLKENLYEDLMKKVVTFKDTSRAGSPAPTDCSRESTPRLERVSRQRGEVIQNKHCLSSGPSLRTKQVTFMLFIITVVFVLCFIPHLVLMVINSMDPSFVKDMSPMGVVFYNIFLRSFVINNMANPLIYGFCDKKFRLECANLGRKLLTCGRN